MRKLVLVSMVFLLCESSLYAQSEDFSFNTEEGAFDAGDLLIEISGTPFDLGSTSESSESPLLSFGSFRARYAVTDQIVPRLGVNMDLYNGQSSPDVVTNSSSYRVMPGCEYHFRIEGGFRSFIALDALIGQRFSSRESLSGPSVDGALSVPSTPTSGVSGRSYFSYGAGLGFGADYHFTSRFYIGVEVGFRLVKYMYSDVLVDGEIFIESVQANFGHVNTDNALRIGFKLF